MPARHRLRTAGRKATVPQIITNSCARDRTSNHTGSSRSSSSSISRTKIPAFRATAAPVMQHATTVANPAISVAIAQHHEIAEARVA